MLCSNSMREILRRFPGQPHRRLLGQWLRRRVCFRGGLRPGIRLRVQNVVAAPVALGVVGRAVRRIESTRRCRERFSSLCWRWALQSLHAVGAGVAVIGSAVAEGGQRITTEATVAIGLACRFVASVTKIVAHPTESASKATSVASSGSRGRAQPWRVGAVVSCRIRLSGCWRPWRCT